MRTTFCLLLTLAGCGSDPPQSMPDLAAPADQSLPLDLALSDGPLNTRPYTMNLHVPKGYDPTKPTPIVILLHGYSASGVIQEQYFNLTAVSDAHTFLYVYPDGTIDSRGNHFWNATDACCDLSHTQVDDVAYINLIIDDLKAKFNVDSKRVFLTGHSNGGFLSHRMACDSADRVAAVASLAGATWQDQSKCSPSGPVAVLEVHGDADTVVNYNGGTLLAPFPSAHVTVSDWAAKNGCTGALTATATTYDLDTALVGAETTVEVTSGCPSGAAELWTIHGAGHVPSFNTDPAKMPTWGELVYAWLSAHPKP